MGVSYRKFVGQYGLDACAVISYALFMTATLAKEVRKLTAAEKIRLAEQLWNEAAAQAEELPVPAEHKRLMEKRLAAHLKSPESAITLEEFRRRLARRL